jgi:HEAT repeat protein
VTARLGQAPKIWQTISADQESDSLPVRRAVLMALAAGKLPKAYRPVLEQVHVHGEAELSVIAATILGSSESSRALRHVGTPADHLATLPDAADAKAMLANENGALTSTGLLEALGRMGGKQAASALVSFAKGESHDEELRKHAWRTLRQIKRGQK